MTTGQTATLHSKILDDITRKIVGGAWKPGDQLPKEVELADSYGVSRMTMNKVLTQLAQEGYVTRRKRKGTVVARPRAQSAVMAINNIQDEVAALGQHYSWKLLFAEPRVLSLRELRGLGIDMSESDTATLYLQGLHMANEVPFCLESRAINLTVVPDAETMDFARVVPSHWLLDTMPWTNARHQVRAINAADGDETLLQLPHGNACLEILRKTQIEADWVTYVRLLYPGAAHQLMAEFEGRI